MLCPFSLPPSKDELRKPNLRRSWYVKRNLQHKKKGSWAMVFKRKAKTPLQDPREVPNTQISLPPPVEIAADDDIFGGIQQQNEVKSTVVVRFAENGEALPEGKVRQIPPPKWPHGSPNPCDVASFHYTEHSKTWSFKLKTGQKVTITCGQ
jgi:hypothetical protein